jgi:Zn-dependent peptidase ImmA (M78 family)
VERAAALLGYPVEWVRRPPTERGGVARREGGETLLLNRDYPFRSTAEWRWVLAEELAHAMLGHSALVASDAAGAAPALREPERRREERAARAFAAELLMPAAEVRAEFLRVQPRLRQAVGTRDREDLLREIVSNLAHTFQVSPTAMRARLEALGLLH